MFELSFGGGVIIAIALAVAFDFFYEWRKPLRPPAARAEERAAPYVERREAA